MSSEAVDQITETSTNTESSDAKKVLLHPFICGICTEKFDQLQIFLDHFTSHHNIYKEKLHICKCLYSGDINTDIESASEIVHYKCRICKNKFTSICTLHSHILHCSSDGSYIFDNSRKMVYPLTLHCSYFEARDGENCDREQGNDSEKNGSSIFTGSTSDEMSQAEKVDYILRNVCTLYGNIGKKNKMEKKKVIRKRGRPRKCDKLVTESLNCVKQKKPSQRIPMSEGQETTSENHDNMNELEKDIVVVKVELEERNPYDKTIDSHGAEVKEPSGIENMYTNCNGNFPDKTNKNEDEGDLTDEYTPPDTKDIELKVSPVKKVKIGKEKRKKSPRKVCKRRGSVTEECPHCGKWLKPYRLKIHLVSHTEDRPFKCELCPKAYKYQSHLDSHKLGHQEVKPFYCDKCGKGYTTLTMLKHHSMMHHSDSKPCVCTLCGSSFITNYKLKRHMMKHTGEKSVQCDLCGMGFATRYNLSVHIQGVHKKNLRFTCEECGRNFMTKYQHKVHMMKHSGERPYKCVICRAEYIERKELRRHLKKQHSLLIESNSNISELMDGWLSEKVNPSKIEQEKSTLSHQAFNQVVGQEETGAAVTYITAEETMYSYTDEDICQSTSYYPTMKSSGENSAMKTLQTNDYQMDYPHSQDYSFQNSAEVESLPLTAQQSHDFARYKYTLSDHSIAKDLSRNRDGNFDTGLSLLPVNEQVIKQQKNRGEVSQGKIDHKFIVL